MKPSLTLKRALTFTVSTLAVLILISMDSDMGISTKLKSLNSLPVETVNALIDDPFDKTSIQDSAQYVLRAYYDAIGGDQWTNIKTIHKTGLVSMRAGTSMSLTYGKDMYQGSEGYLLEEINVNDSRLVQVMQDGRVMTIVRNNIYQQTGLEALSFKQHLLPVGDLSKLEPSSARYMGKHLIDGKWLYKVFRGQYFGHDIHEYYGVVSKLKVMTSLGEGCEVKFKNYKSVNGIIMPMLVETYFEEFNRKVSFEIEQIAMNIAIPDSPIDSKSVSIESMASN